MTEFDLKSARALWTYFCEATGESGPVPDVDWFGDDSDMAEELLALVLTGQKQATCELLLQFTEDDLPRVGDYFIIAGGQKIARCIIQTTQVDICPVRDVDEKFAWDEGEGDRSLEYWKRGHDAYFRRSAQRDGFTYDDTMDAVCERFKLVWPKP
jgi:uncharacterized protein YhfF